MASEIAGPSIAGERYDACVPDTLDLVDRAQLALSGLGGTLDPERDCTLYVGVHYACRPPYMYHWAFDYENMPKFAESFPFMRAMCGSDLYLERERAMMRAMVGWLSADDGLYYSHFRPDRPWLALGHAGYEAARDDFANVLANGRMMLAMLAWWARDGDSAWDGRIRALARGLEQIAVDRGTYAYFPDGGYISAFSYPRSGWRTTAEPTGEYQGGEGSVVCYHGHQLRALARWAAASGDERALAFGAKLARFIMKPAFWGADPEPLCVAGDEQGHFNTHLHARCIALRGLLEYGVVANDNRAKEFVRSAYEFARTLGMPRLGWFASYANSDSFKYCEGCALGDMAALAIRLSDAGLGDYWDDVDALARNHLVEGQLVDADLLHRIADASPERPPGATWRLTHNGFQPATVYPGQEVTEGVIERSLGCYAGHSTPTSIQRPWVMQCCTGNGTQGLYYTWEGIVRGADDRAQVNLFLNRASPWLDVESYLPYEGRVVVRVKAARAVALRVPSWVDRRALRCAVDDATIRPRWIASYLAVDGLRPGGVIRLDFPVVDETVSYTALARTFRGEERYTCRFRGGTLVDIAPRDTSPTSYPLYRRDHLQGDRAPLKTVTRFVARDVLAW